MSTKLNDIYVVQDQQRFDRDTNQLVSRFPDLTERLSRKGHVKYLLSPSAAPWNSPSIMKDLRAGLRLFSNEDALVLIGHPVLNAMAFYVAASRIGFVRILQWNGKEQDYMPLEVAVGETDGR